VKYSSKKVFETKPAKKGLGKYDSPGFVSKVNVPKIIDAVRKSKKF
jgi:hypothetical protein